MGELSLQEHDHISHVSTGMSPRLSQEFIRAATDDVPMVPVPAAAHVSPRTRHFIVAVDFGTTFSCVSVYCRYDSESDVISSQIDSISNYPYAISIQTQGPCDVPTQSWYPRNMHLRQPLETMTIHNDRDDSSDTQPDDEDAVMLDVVDVHEQCGPENGNHIGDDEDEDDDFLNVGNDDHDFMDEDNEIIDRYYWGYGVTKMLTSNDTRREQSRRIVRSKLLLDRSTHTKHIRKQLSATVKDLRTRKLIRDETDVIADFLIHLLRHTKSQMEFRYDYHNDCSVEFVLCVPAMWTEKACRLMQNAMTRALRESDFIENSNHDVDNLFIITEPEAAATHVLDHSREIIPGDCFILLDAGGGTVDAITYKVRSRGPLRLEREVLEPEGALCGSSYLNEEFEKLLWKRLAGHHEVEKDGVTLQGKIDQLLNQFETQIKRGIDIYSNDFEGEVLSINGLVPRDDESKYMKNNRLFITKKDFLSIFERCLKGVSKLMFSQLEQAEKADVMIEKVILIGGFASSPSLHRYLQKKLDKYSETKGRRIRLVCTSVPSTAVAHGAVLRAANKTDGPERRVRSSFGIQRTEPYEPARWKAHRTVLPWYDPLDGETYIKNTIDWVVIKGSLLPSGTVITRPATHTFPVEQDVRFICKEVLFVSSKKHESHFRMKHPKNKGHEEAGHIIVDMTFLKDDPNFHPVQPGPNERGRIHYRVEFDLVIKIDGRNLRFEARYPRGEDGVVRGERQISIAASFQPGTE